jgi:hypothetical protein
MLAARPLHFFLGGHDLEMTEIAKLLDSHATGRFADAGLAWGAQASSYENQIVDALAKGFNIALVELEDDLPPDLIPKYRLVVIDHHGERAGQNQPTALEQVAQLLGVKLNRWQELVAVNDRGHIAALQEFGATAAEIAEVREADRRAQGVTAEQEDRARQAITAARKVGGTTVIETDLETSSPIADFLDPALGGPGYESLLVLLKKKAAFFGDGVRIMRLKERFSPSWYGGNLPKAGYWGCEYSADNSRGAILAFLETKSGAGKKWGAVHQV